MIRDLYNLLRSGECRRWHSNPDMCRCDEDLAQHQWSVAMIALRLDPGLSREALIYALTHDVGEMTAGDLSYDFKRAHPDFAEAHRAFESDARDKLVSGCNDLTAREETIIKAADWLSAYAVMIGHAPWLRWRDDWVEHRRGMLAALNTHEATKQAARDFLWKLHDAANKRESRA